MKWINKQELKYLGFASLFAFIFFVVILPSSIAYFEQLNPYLQFILFNILIFFFLAIFLKSISTNKKVRWAYSIGILILFLGMDVLIPPLSIDVNGNFATNVTLIQSSSDYIFGMLYNSAGVSGFALFFCVYVLSPIILFILASLLLKNFVKEI